MSDPGAIDCYYVIFFFNDTATTEIYTLSLHDALPISGAVPRPGRRGGCGATTTCWGASTCSRPTGSAPVWRACRSEEHTSELQSRQYLVCRLLLEKKKNKPSHIVVYAHLYRVTAMPGV